MKKLHAYRRNPTEVITVELLGESVQFKANQAGHVVADVSDEFADALIAAAPCGYRVYGSNAEAPAPATTQAPDLQARGGKDGGADESPGGPSEEEQGSGSSTAGDFVITAPGGESYDLATMDDEAVRAFAVQHGLAKPHHSKKGDKLRAFVIESLRAL